MTRLYAINTYGISISRIAGLTPVEVMHWEGSVTRDFVQTLPVADCFFNSVLIIEDFIPFKRKKENKKKLIKARFVDLILLREKETVN